MTQMIDIAAVKALPITLKDTDCRTAKISAFRAATPSVLFGHRLKEVEQLETSIKNHGLMRPLKVTFTGNKLVVIDGRKRLAALRRMRFKNTLPRSLVNIPFVLSTEAVPHLKPDQEQYRHMTSLTEKGFNDARIADALCVSSKQLHMLQSVKRLSSRLKAAFFNETISLAQAWAFSALPQPEAQDSLLLSLGPFASPKAITKAISERQYTPPPASNHQEVIKKDVIALASPPIFGLAKNEFTAHALKAA